MNRQILICPNSIVAIANVAFGTFRYAIAQPSFKISKISQTASKQPRRSKLSVQVKLVTLIYYMTKFQGIFFSQISLMSGGEDDKQGPLTCVAIAAGNKL